MTPRDRVLAAINHQEPAPGDRVPIDFWASNETFEQLQDALGLPDRQAILSRFGVDLRYFNGPSPKNDPQRVAAPGVTLDHWGVCRKTNTITGTRRDGSSYTWTYKHLQHSPLASAESVADVEKHRWPTAELWDYSGVYADCQALKETGCAVVIGADRLDRTAQLKPAMYIRGTEQFMADLALEPAIAEAILTHISDYYLEYNRRLFEAAAGTADVFFMGDDMGTQSSTWVSVDMYRRFFKKRFAAYCELAHRYGMKTMYHTCGNVTTLIGEFIDCGLDILQSLQPSAIGDQLGWIKKEYGRDLAFQGGIDIQEVLPSGSPQEVRRHVNDRRRILAPGGGYIFGTAHNILPDVPLENILALIEAYQQSA